MTGRLVLVREGHGEAEALETLVARVALGLGLFPSPISSMPESIRRPVTSGATAVAAVEIAARYNPDAVLVTADCDDLCPRDLAPDLAASIRARGFSFPVAVVLFYREYETLAISVAARLDGLELKSSNGTPIVTMQYESDTPTDPEIFRDAKGWITRNLFGGHPYKPTAHQKALTAVLKLSDLEEADLSSFRRLRSALAFLANEMQTSGTATYPAPPS